jgi:hypothetical protein
MSFILRRHAAARSAPKQRLSAIHHVFDRLVGQVIPANPGLSASQVVKRGKPPVLSPEEAWRMIDASNHAGLGVIKLVLECEPRFPRLLHLVRLSRVH